MENPLPAIPPKRYFTIGEVSELCGVKPYVLRYWEQEFTQLRPMKRRGNRRYYQHHEVLLIRRIRDLLYEQGFTISGARNRLSDGGVPMAIEEDHAAEALDDDVDLDASSEPAAATPDDVSHTDRAPDNDTQRLTGSSAEPVAQTAAAELPVSAKTASHPFGLSGVPVNSLLSGDAVLRQELEFIRELLSDAADE
jgi:DNA-binding transcriptional MerR regulator